MLKYIFPIAFALLALSCTTEEKPTPEKENDQETVVDESNVEHDNSSVLSRSQQFFDWYLENSRMLYRMRSSCIGAENGFHALNETKLKEYTDWLTNTGFFSQAFIDTEHDRWTTECAEEMREKARKKEHFTGPPPCVFEGDIFLKIQEQPTQEMIDSLAFSISEQTDNRAEVIYDGLNSLVWSSKNGSWKIDAWPN